MYVYSNNDKINNPNPIKKIIIQIVKIKIISNLS